MNEESFIYHLSELRKRIIYTVLFLSVNFILAFVFKDKIISVFIKPIHFAKLNIKLFLINITESFTVTLAFLLYFTIFISFPFILYQIWLFIKPALYEQEINIIKKSLLFSTIMFYIGTFFAYFIVLPLCLKFFFSFSKVAAPIFSYASFLSFSITVYMIFAFIFQTPFIIYILIKGNIIEKEKISENRKVLVVIIFIAAAILTPPDPLSQIFLALPLYFLFELGLLLAKYL